MEKQLEKIKEMEKKMEENEGGHIKRRMKKVMEIKEETKKKGDAEKGRGQRQKREKKIEEE